MPGEVLAIHGRPVDVYRLRRLDLIADQLSSSSIGNGRRSTNLRSAMASTVLAFALIAAGCGSTPVSSAPVTAADIALYEAPDRVQRLVEGARREAELSIYTSTQASDLGAVVEAYEKRYGVRATIWRASSEAVLNRALQEARAGRYTVDIVDTNGPELEALSREQHLQRVKSPHHADLIAPAIPRTASGWALG